MDIQLADQSYEMGDEGGAEIICKNVYIEPKPPGYDGRGLRLLSAAGLSEFIDLGGEIRGLVSSEGLFDGDIFAVVGNDVKRINSAGEVATVGSVTGEGRVTMAASRIEIAICVAPNLYVCDGESVTLVDDEDLPNVTSVAHINQRFVMSDDTDRVYWTDLLDGASIDGLNFLTAERLPDKLVRIFSDGEILYAAGTDSIEAIGAVTNPTSASNAFAAIGSGVLKAGLAGVYALATDVETKTVGFLSDQRIIYVTNGYELSEISTPYITNELQKASEIDIADTNCFSYTDGSESFFIVNVPNLATFVYGKKSGRWHMRETFGRNTWRANMHVRAFGKNYVAERGAGVLWNINRNILTDGGGLISREFSAMLPVRSNQHISELVLDAFTETRGVKISMRQSDNGREWSSFVDREMTNPDYEAVSVWRRLGKSRPPKRLFHFRITDPCAFSINGARVNDGQIR